MHPPNVASFRAREKTEKLIYHERCRSHPGRTVRKQNWNQVLGINLGRHYQSVLRWLRFLAGAHQHVLQWGLRWNPVSWTMSVRDQSDRFSARTSSSLDNPVLVDLVLDVVRKEANSSWPTRWEAVPVPVLERCGSLKRRTDSWLYLQVATFNIPSQKKKSFSGRKHKHSWKMTECTVKSK